MPEEGVAKQPLLEPVTKGKSHRATAVVACVDARSLLRNVVVVVVVDGVPDIVVAGFEAAAGWNGIADWGQTPGLPASWAAMAVVAAVTVAARNSDSNYSCWVPSSFAEEEVMEARVLPLLLFLHFLAVPAGTLNGGGG